MPAHTDGEVRKRDGEGKAGHNGRVFEGLTTAECRSLCLLGRPGWDVSLGVIPPQGIYVLLSVIG